MKNENPYFDTEIRAAIGVFEGFLNFEQFKNIANGLHDIRVKNKTNKQLNNIKEMKVLTTEITQWLQNVWFSKAIETGLKYFAFVVPKSTVASLSMKTANDGIKEKTGIEIQYFGEEQEAKKWLKSK